MFLAHTYFTSLPYTIYNEANRHGNMAYAGIGLGLIKSQQMFWIANMGVLAIYLNKDLFILLAPFCCYMYTLSMLKILYLQNIIPM
jgi:hypothetical protein